MGWKIEPRLIETLFDRLDDDHDIVRLYVSSVLSDVTGLRQINFELGKSPKAAEPEYRKKLVDKWRREWRRMTH